jgi:UbiD family decarboxylase
LDSKGELVKIKEYVDPVLEIAEITDRVSKQPDGGKALLFENTGTSFPVITNMLGSKRRILYALGVESFEEIENYLNSLVEEITRERHSLIDKIKLLPQLKRHQNGSRKPQRRCTVSEMVLFKPELDRLPILKCWPQTEEDLLLCLWFIPKTLKTVKEMWECTECRFSHKIQQVCTGTDTKQEHGILPIAKQINSRLQ